MDTKIETKVVETILRRYGFAEQVTDQKNYIHAIEENGWMKLISRVTLEDGTMLVIKILHEDDDHSAVMKKVMWFISFQRIKQWYRFVFFIITIISI